MIGSLINKALQPLGMKLARIEYQGWLVGSVADSVSTLIDVGSAYGTQDFYNLNRQAELFLIDPLKEYEPYVKEILKNRKGRYEITALGKENGSIMLNVQVDHPTKSTILDHTALTKTGGRIEQREVLVKTLDSIILKHALKPPFGIKIDAEGFELEVIRGAKEALSQTDFIIAETSVQKRFENSYTFVEFISEMFAHGFEVSNILSAKPDKAGLVRFMDILYVRQSNLIK
jgi:FkbM family methyltransferase